MIRKVGSLALLTIVSLASGCWDRLSGTSVVARDTMVEFKGYVPVYASWPAPTQPILLLANWGLVGTVVPGAFYARTGNYDWYSFSATIRIPDPRWRATGNAELPYTTALVAVSTQYNADQSESFSYQVRGFNDEKDKGCFANSLSGGKTIDEATTSCHALKAISLNATRSRE